MATYLYDQFRRGLFGYASAVSIVIFALSLVVALLYQRFALRRDLEGRSRWLTRRSPRRHSPGAAVPAPRRLAPRAAAALSPPSWSLVVLAVIVVPLTFSVLGGFRSNQQLVEHPVGLPDPWVIENYTSHPADRHASGARSCNSTLIAAAGHVRRAAGGVDGGVRHRPLPVPGPRARLRAVHARPAVPGRRRDPAAVRHAAPGRPAQQPARRRPAAGRVRAAARDRDHAAVLPGDPPGDPGCRVDRRLRAVALLLVGHAAAVAAGAQHHRRDHDRRRAGTRSSCRCSC